ncbi:hypothetical protein SEUCBS139899_007166 [Sporothrix eucalyptigena]|uniref:Uncharacterized protein n=1 Tax=Sporothrix eucalyptigena TaxID=1812306 RepID=A0ABP0C3T9_9PEZI
MASPSSLHQGHVAAATSIVKNENDDAQSVLSHASSETAPAVQPPPTAEAATGSKRSAPSSPDQNADGEATNSNKTLDGETAKAGDANGTTKTAEETTTNDADESTPPPAKRRTMCGVCLTEPSNCSVACSRIHRENHPPDAPDDDKKKSTLPSASTVPSLPPKPAPPPHPFQVLDDAPELKRLFVQYPNLPARLRAIYEATLPPSNAPNNGGQDPRLPFRLPQKNTKNGGGKGGKGSSNSNNNASSKPWSKEMGLRQGQKALRRARVDPGEDGDAVRAYCETVTFLLARDVESAASTSKTADSNSIVRDELAVEANALIQRLMDAEGRK